MNDYDIAVKLKFKSNKSLEETKEFLIDALIGYDVEIQNILSNDDIYYNRDFEIIDNCCPHDKIIASNKSCGFTCSDCNKHFGY